jgi:hypothetical protein
MAGREVVERMLAFVETEHVAAGGPAGDLAAAWLVHVTETARAALLLNRRGLQEVAAPLRRSVMEHALWMHWLSRNQDIALDTVRAKRRRAVALNEAALREWADWPPAAVDEVMKIEERHVPSVKELIADLVDAERSERPGEPTTNQGWYPAYWSDSESSHPSLSTAARHDEDVPHDAMLGATVLLALSAYSQLLPGDPWSDQIERFAEELAEAVRR